MRNEDIKLPPLPALAALDDWGAAFRSYAREAVRMNLSAKPAELRPFDLAAAKRGEPLVTRKGRKAHFIAHDPGANEYGRVLARVEGFGCANAFHESGAWRPGESEIDLFMAPKPTRTVWVNLYPQKNRNQCAAWHYDENSARSSALPDAIAVAVPVEIDA